MAYEEKFLVCISYYSLRLPLPPQLRKITQRHKIMCGWEILIQNGTYQELLNHWSKRQLRYIKNHANSLTRVSVEQLNEENIFSRYGDVVLPDREPTQPCAKYSSFANMCDFPEKYTKLPKWSCVLNCCSECPGVFVPDAEINYEDDVNLPFVLFHYYGNISSCSFHKRLLLEHVNM